MTSRQRLLTAIAHHEPDRIPVDLGSTPISGISAVGDMADVCRFGDDLGTDTGPFMASATYRKLFKSRHAELCRFVHENSTMPDVRKPL